MTSAFIRNTIIWFAGIYFFEALSRAVVFHPWANSAICLVIAGLMFFVGIVSPSTALGLLVVEYLIGSKGYLFHIGTDPLNHGGVSLRIAMFVAFFLGWIVRGLRRRTQVRQNILDLMRTRRAYLVLAIIWLWTVVRGAWLQQAFVRTDAQPWLAWLLLIPVLDTVQSRQEEVKTRVLPALVAGILWLALETMALIYVFTHHFDPNAIVNWYLWIRRTGVGEITRASDSLYRIFLQSQVYAVVVLIAAAAWWFEHGPRPLRVFVVSGLCAAELILSLSRSFWLGAGFGSFACIYVLLRRKRITFSIKKISASVFGLAFSIMLGVGCVAAAVYFPFPYHGAGNIRKMIEARTDVADLAGVSRWNLLPAMWQKILQHPFLGSGFGATVTFQSKDPRITQVQPDGWYTAHAFEWGWLTFWLQGGVFGLLSMFWLLGDLLRRTWRSNLPDWLAASAIGSIISLAVIHILTPYLNHPLGIAFLIAVEALLV